MKKLVFATNNAHKLQEIRQMLDGKVEILSLADIGCHDDIPETGNSFRENALQKARWIKDKYGFDCFADDSGLEVEALGGEPGIHSARYSGKPHDDLANNLLLLERLKDKKDRSARFRTVIALIMDDATSFFEGQVAGTIIDTFRGDAGFGYDPLFLPDGWSKTFAQASAEEKNSISHRGRAVAALVDFLLKND